MAELWKIQMDAARMALKARRGEVASDNLSVMSKQMLQQLSEQELKDLVSGANKEAVDLKPLPKEKPKYKTIEKKDIPNLKKTPAKKIKNKQVPKSESNKEK